MEKELNFVHIWTECGTEDQAAQKLATPLIQRAPEEVWVLGIHPPDIGNVPAGMKVWR
jgi:hypothetical protein